LPATSSISGGTDQTFTWVYRGTGTPGSVQFSAVTSGLDANDGSVVSTGASASSTLTVQANPNLSVDAYPSPATVVRGTAFTLRLTVTNTGASSATVNGLSVTVLALDASSVGIATVLTPSPVSSINLSGGASSVFTYTYSATGDGTLNFSVVVAGFDGNLDTLTRTATNLVSSLNRVVVLPPSPTLAASFSLPLTRTVGQTMQIIMTVTNTGLVGATGVTFSPSPLLTVAPGGAATYLSGPFPAAGTVNIPVGNSARFTWTYSAASAGTVTFSQTVVAFDGVGATTTASATSLIQSPVVLSSFFSATPTTLNLGSDFTLVLTVSNTGGATATGVYVPQYTGVFWHELSSILPSGTTVTAGISRVVDAVQPISITGGGTGNFTFVYHTSGVASGTLVFSNSAVGTDANSGLEVLATSAPATNLQSPSIAIQRPSTLASNLVFSPSSVNTGQTFTVRLTLTNVGDALITNLRPNPPTNSPIAVGVGTGNRFNGPTPVPPVNLSGGSSVTFTWAYTATGAGSLTFNLTSIGTDNNLGTQVSLSSTSNVGTINNPTVLTASATVSPNPVSVGFPVTVVVSVQSLSATSSDAINTSVTAFGQSPSTLANLAVAPSPSSLTVPASSTRSFTYVYNAVTSGSVTFTHTVQATNADTGALISLTPINTTVLVVNPAAILSSVGVASPGQLSVGQTATLLLSVSNSGGAQALSVTPSVTKLGTAAAGATPVLVPSIRTVGVGQTQVGQPRGLLFVAGISVSDDCRRARWVFQRKR
jgi:hypothetical protein